jgi:membrane-associated protease RseP (regulator of RpoE activity)
MMMGASASIPGILVTIIVLGLLIAIHESGHFLAAKSLKIPVRQFAIGFGPKIVGFRWGETECRLNWIPLGGYCAFLDDSQEGEEVAPDDQRLMRNRPIWQRTWVVSAGVIFNFVFAWLILWVSILAMGAPTGKQIVSVQDVSPNMPAAQVGLKKGDRFVSLAGEPIKDFPQLQTLLKDHKGQPLSFQIDRDGQAMTLSATPTAEGKLGFIPALREEKAPAANPIAAMGAATDRQLKITSDLWNALGQLVSKPDKMIKETGGPIAIVAFGDQIFQLDPWKLVDFAVLLSIELAIINILPLPALDGGHLVMLLLEKLRGRPLPRRLEESILMAGFVLIMGLGVLLILKDVVTVPGMYQGKPPATQPAAPHK